MRLFSAAKIVLMLTAGVTCADSGFAAEGYPSKPIRMVVGFPPGGFVDFTARLVSTPLGTALGQQVIVENRGLLAVHPSLPARSVKELTALARAKPGAINYASAGSGTSTHLAAVLFEHLARVKMVHVPFKGGGPAIVALIAGEVPVTFGTAASVSPQVKAGKLRGLGVTSGKRSAVLPDIPTIAERGLPGYEMLNWLGLFAPAGTPRGIVDRLAAESLRIVRTPDIVSRFNSQGTEPSPLATEEFAAFVKSEVEKWAKVVAATGMTAE